MKTLNQHQVALPFGRLATVADATTLIAAFGLRSRSHILAVRLLARGPISRNDLDSELGVANSPNVILQLRRRGIAITMKMMGGTNRWGETVEFAQYTLDPVAFGGFAGEAITKIVSTGNVQSIGNQAANRHGATVLATS